jgi:hypothetical protein
VVVVGLPRRGWGCVCSNLSLWLAAAGSIRLRSPSSWPWRPRLLGCCRLRPAEPGSRKVHGFPDSEGPAERKLTRPWLRLTETDCSRTWLCQRSWPRKDRVDDWNGPHSMRSTVPVNADMVSGAWSAAIEERR